MPPRGEQGRQTPDALLSSLVRLASAVDPSRGSDHSRATPRELARIDQQLHQLIASSFHYNEETHRALAAAPQARAALLQLLSSSMRAVASELAAYSYSSGVERSSSSSGAMHYNYGAAQGFQQGRGNASSGRGVGAATAAVGRPTGRWAQTLQHSAGALTTYFSAYLTNNNLSPALSGVMAAVVKADVFPACARLVAAARHGRQPSPLTSGDACVCAAASGLLGAIFLDGSKTQEWYQQLFPALADSFLLEHWATDAAGAGGQGRLPNAEAVRALIKLVQMISHGWRKLKTQAEAGPHVRRILHGPCLQYFVAAHVVSQLHAADGGPLYGMPQEVLLPPLPATGQEWQQQEFQGQGQGRQQRRRRTERRLLSAEGLTAALTYWKHLDMTAAADDAPLKLPSSEPPLLGPRNLATLCLRTARVALASAAQLDGSCPGGEEHRPGAGGSCGAVLWRRLDASPKLALTALELATELVVHTEASSSSTTDASTGSSSSSSSSGSSATTTLTTGTAASSSNSSGGPVDGHGSPTCRKSVARFLRQWWPLAVATVRCAMRHPGECANVLACHQYSALLDLSSLPSTLSHGLHFGAPPPGLRHALIAGYIPCYEALLRRTLRVARESPTYDALGIKLVWWTVKRLPCLPLLLAHGDGRHAAALTVTVAKALLVMDEEQGRGGGGGGSSASIGSAGGGGGGSSGGIGSAGGGGGGSSGGIGSVGGGGGGSSGDIGGPGGGKGTSASGSAGGGGGGGTNGSGGGTSSGTRGHGSGRAGVRNDVAVVCAASLLLDLVHIFDTVIVGFDGEGADDGAAGTGEAGERNAGVEIEAEAEAAEADAGQGSSSGTVQRAASPRVASTAGRAQLLQLATFALRKLLPVCVHLLGGEGAAAGSQQSLLLPPVRLAMAVVLQGFEGASVRGDLDTAVRWQQLLADCGGPWLELLRDEGGDEPQDGVREGVSEKPERLGWRQLLSWLLRAVMQQPEHGMYPGKVAAEGSCGQGGAADGVGPPPPCGFGEVLRTCCNPLCTNLAGDSEAGLEAELDVGLQQRGCRAGVGREERLAGCYCSGACAVAHQVARRRQWGVARTGGGASSVGAGERA